MLLLKQLLSFVASIFSGVVTDWIRDYRMRRDAVKEAELESIKREKAKVDAAIDAGNDPKRVHVENDPQDRANRRKS